MPDCKQCGEPISQKRIDNSFSKSVIFCSKKCGVNFHNKKNRVVSEYNRIKKCEWCNKPTTRHWCCSSCYHLAHSAKKNKLEPGEFDDINRGFAWDEPDVGIYPK